MLRTAGKLVKGVVFDAFVRILALEILVVDQVVFAFVGWLTLARQGHSIAELRPAVGRAKCRQGGNEMRTMVRRSLVGAVAAAVMWVVAMPAQAQVSPLVVGASVGTGMSSQPLTLTPEPMSYSATEQLTGSPVEATCSYQASGVDSLTVGSGTFTETCTSVTGMGYSFTGTYTRSGVIMLEGGNKICVWVPNPFPPPAYIKVCVWY